MKAEEALDLFRGWFNNKMMVVLFRIQHSPIHARKGRPVDVREQLIFLNDIQHHYSRHGHRQREFYDAANWLKAFFRVYPKGITPERGRKAWQMIRRIYEGFGFRFPFQSDGTRKEEGME